MSACLSVCMSRSGDRTPRANDCTTEPLCVLPPGSVLLEDDPDPDLDSVIY